MDLLDTHLHLLHPETFAYPWRDALPALHGAFRLPDYRRDARVPDGSVRVVSAIFMEVDVPDGDAAREAAFFSDLADADRDTPALCAVVASARPESASFPERLEALAANPRVRGIRRVLHTMPDGLSADALFVGNLRRLETFGLTFDLCVTARQLPVAIALATRCPGVRFILDHCGVPDVAGGGPDSWRDDIRKIAALPNVSCKLSGLPAYADPARALTPQVEPFFMHVLENFGPERLVWGSDWPVCNLTFGLRPWLETTAALLGKLTPGERDAIARGNATRLYRIDRTQPDFR